MSRVVLLLLVLLLALSGCVSSGDAYQASSFAFIVAVDAASELRAAGKLNEQEIEAINVAVKEGSSLLHAWGEKLKAGEDYPEAEPLIRGAVQRIRLNLLEKRRE